MFMHAAAAEKRGVIRQCRKVKAKGGSVFQPTLRMAGLPITLRSLVQCAVDEKPPSNLGGSDARARRGQNSTPICFKARKALKQLRSRSDMILPRRGST
jgi:hypothetical protein